MRFSHTPSLVNGGGRPIKPLTAAKLIGILQRMDPDAPVIVEGDKDAPPAVGVSRTYKGERKVIIRRAGGSCGDELPILSR